MTKEVYTQASECKKAINTYQSQIEILRMCNCHELTIHSNGGKKRTVKLEPDLAQDVINFLVDGYEVKLQDAEDQFSKL